LPKKYSDQSCLGVGYKVAMNAACIKQEL